MKNSVILPDPANITVMRTLLCLSIILLYARLFPRDRLTVKEQILLVCASLAAAFVCPGTLFAAEVPVLLYAAMIDRRTGEIPDLCAILLLIFALGEPVHYFSAAFGVLVLTGLLAVAGLLGFGDVKIMAAWTIAHGRMILSALSVSCWLCLLYCFTHRRKKQIPFAPFLAFGFLFVQLFVCCTSGNANQNVLPLPGSLSTP